jgi:hypothetical protein
MSSVGQAQSHAGLNRRIERASIDCFGGFNVQYTHNTLPENIRANSVELLSKHLAAATDLHALS